MLTRSHRAVMQLSAFGVGAMLLLTGCDFWPPALQAQIEQLHSEAQRYCGEKPCSRISSMPRTRQRKNCRFAWKI